MHFLLKSKKKKKKNVAFPPFLSRTPNAFFIPFSKGVFTFH